MSFTGEMQRTMEELKVKAETLGEEAENDLAMWTKYAEELKILDEQKTIVKRRIQKRESTRKEFDKTLVEAQVALKKVKDTCSALMSVMGRQAVPVGTD